MVLEAKGVATGDFQNIAYWLVDLMIDMSALVSPF